MVIIRNSWQSIKELQLNPTMLLCLLWGLANISEEEASILSHVSLGYPITLEAGLERNYGVFILPGLGKEVINILSSCPMISDTSKTGITCLQHTRKTTNSERVIV